LKLKINMIKRLSDLRPGQECVVEEIHGGWGLKRRLAEMGIFRGVRVKVLAGGPWGGPLYIEILPTSTRCSVGHGAASRIMVDVADGVPPNPTLPNEKPRELCRQTPKAAGRGWRFWRRRY
jgi:ferrous iron transport protein A